MFQVECIVKYAVLCWCGRPDSFKLIRPSLDPMRMIAIIFQLGLAWMGFAQSDAPIVPDDGTAAVGLESCAPLLGTCK